MLTKRFARLVAAMALIVGAITGPVILDTGTANAAVGVHIQETFGAHFRVGAANLNNFTSVREAKPGRVITQIPAGSFGKLSAFKLRLSNTKCVAGSNDNARVVVRPCNQIGTVWARQPVPKTQSVRWINVRATKAAARQTRQFLSGHDRAGSQFMLFPRGTVGALQRFNTVP